MIIRDYFSKKFINKNLLTKHMYQLGKYFIYQNAKLRQYNLIYNKLHNKSDEVLLRYRSFLNHKNKSSFCFSLFNSDTQIKLNSIEDILFIRNTK
jgi:hypothetical protein